VALTPIEVENTQFRVAFRGYAIDEVDASSTACRASWRAAARGAGRGLARTDPGGLRHRGAGGRTADAAARPAHADEAVAEARAEAEQIRAAAREEAEATLASTLSAAREEAETARTSARAEAEAALAAAREEADRVLSASRAEAAGLDEQIAQRLEAALGDLDRRRSRLEGSIEELRAFEREYRTRLRAYLEGQLRELSGGDGPDDDGVGVPVGAGGAAVGRPVAGAVRLDSRTSPQDGTAPPTGPAPAPAPAAPTTDR
jgi:DivIVA domain-containing protein